jgi:hypothetical protein
MAVYATGVAAIKEGLVLPAKKMKTDSAIGNERPTESGAVEALTRMFVIRIVEVPGGIGTLVKVREAPVGSITPCAEPDVVRARASVYAMVAPEAERLALVTGRAGDMATLMVAAPPVPEQVKVRSPMSSARPSLRMNTGFEAGLEQVV